MASERGYIEIVKLLLSMPYNRGINPAGDNNYAIRMAARNDHLEIVKMLLADIRVATSVSIQDHLVSSIQHASKYGHLDVLKFLLPRMQHQENAV
jgi:ankyrin repeat protein